MFQSRTLGVCASVVFAAACAGNNGNLTDGSGGSVSDTGAGVTGATGTTGPGGNTTSATTGSGPATSTGSGAGTSSGGGLFKTSEPWNTPVDQEPADSSSAAIIKWLSGVGWGAGEIRIDFSIGIQYANDTTPMKPFTKTDSFWAPDCDDLPAFPVPVGGHVEGERGYACSQGGDCHLLVVDSANEKLYEMYNAFLPPSSTVFNGGCSVVWDLKRAYPDNLRGEGCTSADAGGFPIAAMLFTADEVAAGHIDHAIRFILPNSSIRGGDVYAHPGTHTTSSTSGPANAPPYGVRFRLKPTFDLSKLPSEGARTVARALQKYGMLLADGGTIALTAADDTFTTAKWDDANVKVDGLALSSIQVSDFEVVGMGKPTAARDCARNP